MSTRKAAERRLCSKARLFHEHWTLIAVKPHGCAWTSVKDGTVRTLHASDLCKHCDGRGLSGG